MLAVLAVVLIAGAFAESLTDDATPSCKVVEGRIIGADSIASVSTSDAGFCCLACYNFANCQSWTLDRASSTCFLKNNTVDSGPSPNHVSGYLPSSPPSPPAPPTPVPIPQACTGSYAKLPFCDDSLDVEQRIDYLISLIRDGHVDSIPPLLTARASPNNDIPGVIPEYDWGMNAVHGVQSRCGYLNVSVGEVDAVKGAKVVKNAGSYRRYNCATSFSSPNTLGGSWNMTQWQAIFSVVGVEARSLWLQGVGENHGNGLPHMGLDAWSPNINVNRDPRWGRNQEVIGEDPLMLGTYGSAYVRGTQEGVDPNSIQLVTTLKHWAAYSLESYGNATRHNFNAIVSPFMFASTYFPGFEMAVKEGGSNGIMCSYNAVNGVPSCANSFLAGVLRDEWGFLGYQTSDSGAVNDVVANHHYVSTPEEAAAVCINNTGGRTDINSGGVYSGHLLNALSQNITDWESIDRALRNHFRIRFWLGLFDHFDSPYWHVPESAVHTEESENLNVQAAMESLILLRNNDNTLPLKPGSTVAVIGPHGDAQGDLLGNYLGEICPFEQQTCFPSILDAITTSNVGGKTLYAQGCDVFCTDTSGFGQAVETAHEADVVLIFAGINQQIEREGHDRVSIDLPGYQHQLIANLTAIGKPTVLVLINGGMVAIDKEATTVDAIIEAGYPGYQGAVALANTIFGANDHLGGKLPFTLYANDSIQEFDFFDMDISTAPGRTYRFYTGTPTYPFGHGLSYTSFSVEWSPQPPTPGPSNRMIAHNPESIAIETVDEETVSEARRLTLDARKHGESMAPVDSGNVASGAGLLDEVVYTITVTNTGKVAGDEVVQGYFVPKNVSAVDPRDASKVPLARQLFAFQRVHLAPGASTKVTFTLDAAKLAVPCPKTGNVLSAPGEFTVQFTNGVDQILSSTVHVTGEEKVIDGAVPRQLAIHGNGGLKK